MKKIDELRWVRVFTSEHIPNYLVEQVRHRTYSVEEFYKFQQLNLLMQGADGVKLNPFNIGNNKQGGVQRVLPQTGKIVSIPKDAARDALLPGKRISKTGKVYWETRKNRSDAPQKNI